MQVGELPGCHSNGMHRRRTPQAEPELPIIARVDALPACR